MCFLTLPERELSWVNMQVGEEGKDGVLPEVQSPFHAVSSEAELLQHIFEDHCVGAVCDSQIFHFSLL